MSIVKDIAKNAFYLTFGEVLSKALFFILTILIARNLGSEELGKFSFAISFVALFYVIADFGLNKLILRELSKNNNGMNQYFWPTLILKSGLAILTLIAISIVIGLTDKPMGIKILVIIAGINMILTESLCDLFRNMFISLKKIEYDSALIFIEYLIIFCAGYYFLLEGLGVKWVLIALVIGGLFRTVMSIIIIIDKFKPTYSKEIINLKQILIMAYPFCLTYLLATLYLKIDITMLSLMKGDLSVGIYSAATNLIFSLIILPTISMRAIFPSMSRLHAESKEAFLKSCNLSLKYVSMLAVPITIGGIFLSKQIILFVYKKEFIESSFIFQILMLFFLLYFIKWMLNNALHAANLEKKTMWSYVLGVFMNIGLNLILIPKYGPIGAAIATVITELAVVALIYYWFVKHIDRISLIGVFIKPLIGSAAMVAMLSTIPNQSLVLQISIGFITYSLALFLLKGLSNEDIKLVKEALNIKSYP